MAARGRGKNPVNWLSAVQGIVSSACEDALSKGIEVAKRTEDYI